VLESSVSHLLCSSCHMIMTGFRLLTENDIAYFDFYQREHFEIKVHSNVKTLNIKYCDILCC
jgi:hypothetical protein